jgi:hypothetical protein
MDSATGGSSGGDAGDECGSHEDFREIEVREQDRYIHMLLSGTMNLSRLTQRVMTQILAYSQHRAHHEEDSP